MRRYRCIACAVLLVFVAAPCYAGVLFATGNKPQSNEQNILLSGSGSGATVFGTTNQSSLKVSFSSTTDVLSEPSNGQARITAADGLINNITISVPGGFFVALILNPFKGTGPANLPALANKPGRGTETFTFKYDVNNGQNFVTVTTTGGETIASLTIDSTSGFQDLRQPRISDAALLPVGVPSARAPEPATFTLLGLGIAGMAAYKVAKRGRNG
jgi:hypothetical protein